MLQRLLNKLEQIWYYRHFAKVAEGPYKFLTKKISKSTDIDFVERVWQLDHFREILDPQPLALNELKKVLILAPHQDDEVIGCGGTLLQLSENESNITIGFLTDGAELSNPERSVGIRASEANVVSKVLNAEVRELGIDNISMEVDKKHLKRLTAWLDEDWDAIFTIWYVDQPPKHRVCAFLLAKAIERSKFTGDVYQFAVHTDLLPNVYVDITDMVNQKQQLLACYESQIRVQAYDHLSKGLDAWRSRFLPVSGEKRYVETFMHLPAEAYVESLDLYKQVDSDKLFKGHLACIQSFNQILKI